MAKRKRNVVAIAPAAERDDSEPKDTDALEPEGAPAAEASPAEEASPEEPSTEEPSIEEPSIEQRSTEEPSIEQRSTEGELDSEASAEGASVEPINDETERDLVLVTNHDEPTQDEGEPAEADEDTSRDAPSLVGRDHLKHVIESLVFVSDRPISVAILARHVKAKHAEVQDLLEQLIVDYRGRGIELVETSGGYQFRSAPITAPFVRDLVAQRPVRLTRAQLETLALVAYRQPVTRPEIDDVRGVDSGSAIKVLLDRGLLKLLGRKDEAGRPLLYGTTPFFLEFFGMKALKDLPTLREFSDLSEESRELFKRKLGEAPQDTPALEPSTEAVAIDPDDEEDTMAQSTPNDELEAEAPKAGDPEDVANDDDLDEDDDLDDDDDLDEDDDEDDDLADDEDDEDDDDLDEDDEDDEDDDLDDDDDLDEDDDDDDLDDDDDEEEADKDEDAAK